MVFRELLARVDFRGTPELRAVEVVVSRGIQDIAEQEFQDTQDTVGQEFQDTVVFQAIVVQGFQDIVVLVFLVTAVTAELRLYRGIVVFLVIVDQE